MYIYNCERMKLPSCPRTLIINILRKHPDGLTITSIAELAGMHRHTATKYVYELKGAGVINERDVGSAKLCYLKEGLSREAEKKVVERLNGNGNWRKSSVGQVQILTAFLFLFLVPATIIIAQNATQSINSTAELVIEQMNITADAFTEPNQTNSEMPNASVIIGTNTTPIENISNETISEIQNQTNVSEQNITIQENITAENPTVLNEMISNETIQNETNATIFLPENQTIPPEVQENATIPEILQPILGVRIISPDRTLRGEQLDISAVVSNSGNSDAKNVRLEWIIPSGFEIVSGDNPANCGTLSSNSECTNSLTLSSPISADIGKNEIRVIVKYEE
jgi:predicted transcriptional regulator